MTNLFSILHHHVPLQRLDEKLLRDKNVEVHVLRLDMIHSLVSGNKLFKLYYYLKQALLTEHKTLLTFGGAYSNHLLATAAACSELGLKAIGLVRGERSLNLSHTLIRCEELGMKLEFVSREIYKTKESKEYLEAIRIKHGEFIHVPEGGAGITGQLGAAKIVDLLNGESFTHVCCAAGTGTTASGLAALACSGSEIIVFPVLKNIEIEKMILKLMPGQATTAYKIIDGYHFGGYAKKTSQLLNFMNDFYLKHHIPTDFVYTGKMFFGVWDMLLKNYFPFNSKILCLHTGGLQGNLSLPEHTLAF